jgi:acyl carrier protein
VALEAGPPAAEPPAHQASGGKGLPATPDPPEAAAIEQSLLEHEAVAAAAVIVRGHGRGPVSLAAYVAFGNGAAPTVTELRSWLRSRLPEGAAAPSFVVLDALPVTEDGEVDRVGLARLEDEEREEAASHVPPRTKAEILVAGIWQEVLGLERVSVHDNFFALGGHSLLSVRVVSRIEKEQGIRLDPRDLIFQTLEQVAAACEARMDTVEERA